MGLADMPIGAAGGRLRLTALNEHLLGWPLPAEAEASALPLAAARAWAQGFPATGLSGLHSPEVPPAYRDALLWSGVPLAPHGALHWGREVRAAEAAAGLAVPERLADGTVRVPTPALLRAASGVALRPLRRLIAERCGCRLQTGAGLALFCWPEAVLLLNCRDVPLGGFVHGPRGRRVALLLAPGEHLHQGW